MLTLPIIIAIVSLTVSAVGWGVVWGKTTQRWKDSEVRISELKTSVETVKTERQDLAIAVARLEVKVDQLTQTLQSIREFLGKSVGMNP